MRITLTREEIDYLRGIQSVPDDIADLLGRIHASHDKGILDLSECEASDLRDFVGEQLQLEGFDQAYELTTKGKLIEDLVDKLFVR